MGQSACSGGGESDSSAHETENPGGGSGLHLGTRVSSSGGVAPSGSSTLTSVHSLGALPPSSSLWSTYVSEGYFHTLKTKVLLPHEEGGMGSEVYTTPDRFYGKELRRSTSFLTQCCYQSPHPLSFPLQKKAFRLRRSQAMKDWATT